jgi:hypothetical protein
MGFIKNYSSFNLHITNKITKFTDKEIGFFRDLGEMLGFHVFQEDTREIKGKKRKGDLFWAIYDKKDNAHYYKLHLERESKRKLAEETITDKLADDIEVGIAIVFSRLQNVKKLIGLAKKKIEQNSDVEELLLIVCVPVGRTNMHEVLLILGQYYWKEKNKIKQEMYKAVRLPNEAGHYYALLEEELTAEDWKKIEEKMIDYEELI